VLLVGMTILNGARPEWGRNVDPLAATFNLIGQDGGARSVAVLGGWLVATTVIGAVLTRRRAIS